MAFNAWILSLWQGWFMDIVIFCLVFGDYVKAHWTLQTLLLPEITSEAISAPNLLKHKVHPNI